MSDTELHVSVAEIMSTPVETIDRDRPVSAAARSLYDDRIGSLMVEADGEIAGIVTETDVVGVVARGEPHSTPVSEVASESLVTIERTARVEEAAERMARHGIKKLPVTDEGTVVGIVTTTDVSNYFPSYHPREGSWSSL
jgi:signal-transduction protein with cAMP-binding, CBS, and nucleotidyltransferase domain